MAIKKYSESEDISNGLTITYLPSIFR